MKVAETEKPEKKQRRVYINDGGYIYVKAEELMADPDFIKQLEEADSLAKHLGLKRTSEDKAKTT